MNNASAGPKNLPAALVREAQENIGLNPDSTALDSLSRCTTAALVPALSHPFLPRNHTATEAVTADGGTARKTTQRYAANRHRAIALRCTTCGGQTTITELFTGEQLATGCSTLWRAKGNE